MRVLIVDDEAPARARLRRLLGLEGMADILEAHDALDARRQLDTHPFDLVFLDVQMPGMSGMELAAGLPPGAPQVVFTTAHETYAVPAFDTGAADYLLKPFDSARLQRALERVRARLAAATPAPARPTQLLVPGRGGASVVAVPDIGWIETADNYVVLHTRDTQPLLRTSLGALLAELGPGFVRCHRRAAVQVAWIERVLARAHGDCELLLRNGGSVPCSRQYRAAVMAALRQPAGGPAG